MHFQEVEQQVAAYGYYAVLAGAIVEGETVLLLAALAAAHGLLDLRWVIVCASVSAVCGDNAYFWLGRLQGRWVLRRFPALEPRLARFNALLARWHAPLILLLRFLWGLRTVGPMAVGMSGVPAWRFLLIDGLSAVLWASVYSTLGYLLGQQLLPWLARPDAGPQALRVLAAALTLGVLLVLVWRRRARTST
jgi:membrane protein DedA with SNARE-associated domain